MTESNKQRVVKYWNILDKYKAQSFETLSLFRVVNKREFKASINCAIEEVEASIAELIHYDDTSVRVAVLQSELNQLKQML
jgi:hypothetical protein